MNKVITVNCQVENDEGKVNLKGLSLTLVGELGKGNSITKILPTLEDRIKLVSLIRSRLVSNPYECWVDVSVDNQQLGKEVYIDGNVFSFILP